MIDRIEDWPWSSYLAMVDGSLQPDWLATDWLLSQFGARKKRLMEKYRQFVVDGIQNNLDIWSDLEGQAYLGDGAFMSGMQRKIGNKRDDLNIPQNKKWPVASPLAEIVQETKGRDAAIIAAYAKGAYSQQEISEYFQLYSSTIGVIVRRGNSLYFAT